MKQYTFIIFIICICFIRVYKTCFDLDLRTPNLCIIRSYTSSDNLNNGENLSGKIKNLKIFRDIREYSLNVYQKYLPSPHSELILGMTIGIDMLDKVPKFQQALKDTGTIHVVVVSGFNISLVFGIVVGMLGSSYKSRNIVIACLFTFTYAILSGFEPPVIRSWIMGSLAAIGKYYGKSIDAFKLLIFSGSVMIIINPKYLFSLSFQLSFLATLGLVIYGNDFNLLIKNLFKRDGFLLNDLSSTLSAQVLVLPLISYSFGTVSVISPLINMLILWTVPISTILGIVLLGISLISYDLTYIVAYILFPFLDLFIRLVFIFSKFNFSTYNLKISNVIFIGYYTFLLGLFIKKSFVLKKRKVISTNEVE